MILWVLEQLCGLCHALRVLHNANCRHGDLKPENILLFHEGDYKGTLKIADLGLARMHTLETQDRIRALQKTTTNTATLRYIPPEFSNDVRTRDFDAWSLGCI
jgi:serine/threonine protein kinase